MICYRMFFFWLKIPFHPDSAAKRVDSTLHLKTLIGATAIGQRTMSYYPIRFVKTCASRVDKFHQEQFNVRWVDHEEARLLSAFIDKHVQIDRMAAIRRRRLSPPRSPPLETRPPMSTVRAYSRNEDMKNPHPSVRMSARNPCTERSPESAGSAAARLLPTCPH